MEVNLSTMLVTSYNLGAEIWKGETQWQMFRVHIYAGVFKYSIMVNSFIGRVSQSINII